jgi:hypothetical protein
MSFLLSVRLDRIAKSQKARYKHGCEVRWSYGLMVLWSYGLMLLLLLLQLLLIITFHFTSKM